MDDFFRSAGIDLLTVIIGVGELSGDKFSPLRESWLKSSVKSVSWGTWPLPWIADSLRRLGAVDPVGGTYIVDCLTVSNNQPSESSFEADIVALEKVS